MGNPRLYEELIGPLVSGLQILPDKPEETAESTLRALWHAAAGAPKSAELASTTELAILDHFGEAALRKLVKQRINGVPLAHITGRQRFMDLEMLAGPEALIPRKETELLAHAAVDLASQMLGEQGHATVVDVCTGSGNVAHAVAHYVPVARVFAADISAAAVDLARRNTIHLGLEGRMEVFVGDLLSPFDTPEFHGKVDLVTCNPPYIMSAKVEQMPNEISTYEPSLAFDGGVFGVSILLRLLRDVPRFLRKDAWLVFEVGLGQAPTMANLVRKSPVFREVRTVKDSTGVERVILARCEGSSHRVYPQPSL